MSCIELAENREGCRVSITSHYKDGVKTGEDRVLSKESEVMTIDEIEALLAESTSFGTTLSVGGQCTSVRTEYRTGFVPAKKVCHDFDDP
ncbi:MAG: hypothetical protein AAB546_03905, partial [Patescibacteria group bacterium]